MMAANLNSTMDNLGALCGGQGDGKTDLPNLRRLLETSDHIPLGVYFAQLKADLNSNKSTQIDNGKGQSRLSRLMSR